MRGDSADGSCHRFLWLYVRRKSGAYGALAQEAFGFGARELGKGSMSGLARGFGSITLLLLAFGARAESVANWANTTNEIATDGPNTVRTWRWRRMRCTRR